ncbi:hypothetical protein TCAL_13589 [Tigriopus californicus]|uniref:Uncharacterized protein n=1 Tax=Tigriopus californicus TaxID=6832 RepID=A0A553PU43_TIGCA|nr:alpha-protein kinase 1-like [Tigriopus californicus]TRY81209.1 hypothetical protein TCAL_13589 [Tigriopus californicus]
MLALTCVLLLSSGVLAQENFQYRYQPKEGEFNYQFQQNPELLALEPPQIQASADNAAQATLKVAELLKKVDLKELAELFGADPSAIPDNNFAAVISQIEGSANLIQRGAPALSNIIEKVKARFPTPEAPVAPVPEAAQRQFAPVPAQQYQQQQQQQQFAPVYGYQQQQPQQQAQQPYLYYGFRQA